MKKQDSTFFHSGDGSIPFLYIFVTNTFNMKQTVENYLPLNRQVLLKMHVEKERKTQGGLFIPDAEKALDMGINTGVIVAVAPDSQLALKLGDTVRISRYGGNDVLFDDDDSTYRTILETEIKGVFRQQEQQEE